MPTPSSSAPEIAILGGGIGGLAAAAFLHREGIDAVVYEQAPRLSEVGAGLVVAPNLVRLLRRLGVLERFQRTAVKLDVGWEFRRWEDGDVLSAENLADACERLYGEHTYTSHRADLLDAIRSAVPSSAIRLGKRAVAVSLDGDAPVLEFEDGEIVRPGILIGADGIHSRVRGAMTEVEPARYSGLCAFRALVPAEQAPAFSRRNAQTLWLGPGRHLVHYPVSGGRYVNIVAFAPAGDYSLESWTATATVGEFLAEFEGWDPRLTDLIKAAQTPGRWALLDRTPLTRWSNGAATLLGDAAHPMFPFFAQGAGQAVEDAAVLARSLAERADDPVAALRHYEAVRLPRTTELQQRSHDRAVVNHLPDGQAQIDRDRAFAQADPLVANGWIYGYDIDEALAAMTTGS